MLDFNGNKTKPADDDPLSSLSNYWSTYENITDAFSDEVEVEVAVAIQV